MESVPWPAVAWEERTWQPGGDQVLFRNELRHVGRPYRAAVPARIADLPLALPGPLAAMADEATTELTRLDAAFPGEIGTLTSVLLRSESASSSQIENITASARAVLEAELTGGGTANGSLVADNIQALRSALAIATTIEPGAIESLQRDLLSRSAPRLVGWRREPVWIGAGSSTPVTADYVAPVHERIPELIEDLTGFMNRDDLPVLAQAAIAHAQFETIHPFSDGNGRTGRALVHTMLRAKGVLRHVTVPLSAGLLHERDAYVDALTRYRDGDAAPIVLGFARAGLHGARHGRALLEEAVGVRDSWRVRVKARSDSGVWPLLDHLLAHPVLTADLAGDLLGVTPSNANRLLRTLVEQGILATRADYRSRRTLYRAPELLQVLDRHAEAIGRRPGP